MADLTLTVGQFQLGDVLFGRRTGIECTDFTISEPASTTADLAMPGEDGVMMGRDYLGSRTLSWSLVVNQYTASAGKERWGALEAAWDARETRLVPGAVTALRMQDHGSGVRVAYGRPRKFTPADLSFTRNGAIPVVADFTTVDRFFYDDVEQVMSFGVRPTIGSGGGITPPFTPPLMLSPADTSNSDVVVNAGNAPTWPVIIFTGPIVNPAVVIGDNLHTVRLQTTLADNEVVTIDTRPWMRTITRSDGASLAGTARGSRLADLILMPGPTLIGIQGIDLDGTASGTIRWRSAYTTP